MKSKQEVIQEAYQGYDVDFSTVDNNGWAIDFGAKYDYWDGNFDLNQGRHRPKSLAGIETNNGWTRIESEADLPKTEYKLRLFKVCFVDNDNYILYDFPRSAQGVIDDYKANKITHYRKIEQYEPPIY